MVESAGDAADGYILTPTDTDIYTAVRAWLLSILPGNVRVIQGQQNRAAPPPGPFISMTLIGRERIATNGTEYTDTKRIVSEQVKRTMQLDLFGSASGDMMQVVTALWRDFQASDYFRNSGGILSPLYTSSVRQLGFINGAKQYEDCWSVDLAFQTTQKISIPQQFADTLSIDLIEVDTTYPPQE